MSKPTAKPTLEELAEQANGHHAEVVGSYRTALLHAKLAGDALRKAKRQVPHGGFTGWLKENFHASEETARAYMRVSSQWHRIEPLLADHGGLTLADALHLLRVSRSGREMQEPKESLARSMLKETFHLHLEGWSDGLVDYLSESAGQGANRLDDWLTQLSNEIGVLQ